MAGVAEVAERTHTPPKMLWKHLTAWAQALQSPARPGPDKDVDMFGPDPQYLGLGSPRL
jgi:hypothetical protein